MHFHHKFLELVFPASGLAFIFAQGGDPLERWGSMTAAVVISCLLAYIITQRDPKERERVALLIETINRENNATVKAINERNAASAEKTQQEYVIALQGVTKDSKELVDSVVGKLVTEQGEQRRDLMAWSRGWETFESEEKSRSGDNDKKGFGP